MAEIANAKLTPHIERWPLDKLQDHPDQERLFGPVNIGMIERLRDSLRTYGQKNPLRINRDGCIIAGRKRIKAMKAEGWTHADVVVVRYGSRAEEIEDLILDNLDHRQLSALEAAELVVELVKLRNESIGEVPGTIYAEVKARTGITERHLRRLIPIALAEEPIRAAVKANRLTAILANKLISLPDCERAPFVALLVDGQDIRSMLKEHCTQQTQPEKVRRRERKQMVASLLRLVKRMEQVEDIRLMAAAIDPSQISAVDSASAFIGSLVPIAARQSEKAREYWQAQSNLTSLPLLPTNSRLLPRRDRWYRNEHGEVFHGEDFG